MVNFSNFYLKGRRIGAEELAAIGAAAQKELDQLLKERPQLAEFQKEIDNILQKAGNTENRLAVLEVLIGVQLKKLQQQLSNLLMLAGRL